jgi:hypothetical protein
MLPFFFNILYYYYNNPSLHPTMEMSVVTRIIRYAVRTLKTFPDCPEKQLDGMSVLLQLARQQHDQQKSQPTVEPYPFYEQGAKGEVIIQPLRLAVAKKDVEATWTIGTAITALCGPSSSAPPQDKTTVALLLEPLAQIFAWIEEEDGSWGRRRGQQLDEKEKLLKMAHVLMGMLVLEEGGDPLELYNRSGELGFEPLHLAKCVVAMLKHLDSRKGKNFIRTLLLEHLTAIGKITGAYLDTTAGGGKMWTGPEATTANLLFLSAGLLPVLKSLHTTNTHTLGSADVAEAILRLLVRLSVCMQEGGGEEEDILAALLSEGMPRVVMDILEEETEWGSRWGSVRWER